MHVALEGSGNVQPVVRQRNINFKSGEGNGCVSNTELWEKPPTKLHFCTRKALLAKWGWMTSGQRQKVEPATTLGASVVCSIVGSGVLLFFP